jgi:hypothetical protein
MDEIQVMQLVHLLNQGCIKWNSCITWIQMVHQIYSIQAMQLLQVMVHLVDMSCMNHYDIVRIY